MNRPICFRAWHEGRKKWLHDSKPPLGGCHILGEIIWAFGEWCRVPLAELDQVVVEQFTGLKDRDGNEIYEGDILRCEGMPLGWGDAYQTVYAQVIHDQSTGGFSADRSIYGRTYDPSPRHFWRYEIAGNVHENPNLIRPCV